MQTHEDIGTTDRLFFTVFLAVAVHALVIFGITFTVHHGNKIAPTLNITLATHKTSAEPQTADFLAQHNQEASGTEEKVLELSTREHSKIADINIRNTNPITQQKAATESKNHLQIISTSADRKNQTLKQDDPEHDKQSEQKDGQAFDTPVAETEIASLQARKDEIKQERAKQPRIRRLTSVSSKASDEAEYLIAWTEKFERIGNKHYPQEALNDEILGQLLLLVVILPNGRVEKVEIRQSSGYPILDNAAKQFVKLASPFSPFPPKIRQNTDKLEIYRTLRFEITGISTSSN